MKSDKRVGYSPALYSRISQDHSILAFDRGRTSAICLNFVTCTGGGLTALTALTALDNDNDEHNDDEE